MDPCPSCRAPMDESFAFCPLCGADLRPPDERWAGARHCGHRVVGGAFCPDCGGDVSHRLEAWLRRRASARVWGGWVCAGGWVGFAAAGVWALAQAEPAIAVQSGCAALASLSAAGLGWAWRRDWWRWSPPR